MKCGHHDCSLEERITNMREDNKSSGMEKLETLIKDLRLPVRGVRDIPFFIFRLATIFA